MKIKVECKCGEVLEIELNEKFEVVSVVEVEEESIEVSIDILSQLGLEFG